MRRFILFLFITLMTVGSPALASSIVVPNFATSAVGNATDDVGPGIEQDVRAQQLYGSGQFAGLGPILIDQFAFRAEPGTGVFNATFGNMDIYMSTSQYFPNLNGGPALLMSTTFNTNVGPDNRLVYHGPVSMVSPGCPINGTTPCAFDLAVNLTTPFLYDPNQGRLLMDFHITGVNGGAFHSIWDAVDFSGNPIPYGSIASLNGLLNDVTGQFSADGLITQFRFTAVPEPASMTLLVTGLGAAAAMRRRRITG